MKSAWTFVAVQFCAVFCGLPGLTQEFTGNLLHEECLKPTEAAQNFCYGFIVGASDGLAAGAGIGLAAAGAVAGEEIPSRFLFFCTPPGMTNGQRFDVVTTFIARNPQLRHRRAVELIYDAMLDAFPCE